MKAGRKVISEHLSVIPVQPGMRLVLESFDWEPESVEPLLLEWGGERLETDHSEKILRYSVSTKIPDEPSVIQIVMIQIQQDESDETGKKTTILFEIALMHEDDEDPDVPITNLPPYYALRPQRIINDIVSMGGWSRMGVPMGGSSRKVEFDEVEEWWEDICLEADRIPQVVVGSSLSGDLPVKDPSTASIILSGLANVHHPSSLATMERMNEVMGRFGAPRGSIRILLSDPSTVEERPQPLYSNDRLAGWKYRHSDGSLRHLHCEIHIFLRLAKMTLDDDSVPEYWRGASQIPSDPEEEYRIRREKRRMERLRAIEDLTIRAEELEVALSNTEDAWHSTQVENEALKEGIADIEQGRDDLISELDRVKSELEDMTDLVERYKEEYSNKKAANKYLKKQIGEMRKFHPLLEKFRDSEGATDIDDLLKRLESKMFDEEEVEEDPLEFNSVLSVLEHISKERRDMFNVGPTAFESAKKSPFRYVRRLQEAFEVMQDSYDYLRNLSDKDKTLNYEHAFRKLGKSKFRVANRETKATMDRYGKDRVFSGTEMQAHIKIGVERDAEKTLRIHFLFDRESKCYLIGHCGRHLPTVND